mmetsp:Transcript_35481/g.110681  ORF Transcript_35481/g.110681 Transcript_35481/m.110681 type:complete len:189 (-) Transcript_35481:62-628(-)
MAWTQGKGNQWGSKGKAGGKGASWSSWGAPIKPWVKQAPTKGSKGGKGGGKDGRRKGLFTDLPKSQQKAIQEKWAERAVEEGREEVDDTVFTGTVIWRCRSYGWIKPQSPELLPARVLESMATMTEELRGKAAEAQTDLDRFAEDVLYFRICDRAKIAMKIDKDAEVTFKAYVDSKGAGAMEVAPASE